MYSFFLLACAITWALDLPWVLSLRSGGEPPEWVLLLAGLGAFGPTIAAFILAKRSGELRQVFGRWRTHPSDRACAGPGLTPPALNGIWIPIALLLPAAIHLAATLIEVALGGQPAQWFYPPVRPEHVAALIMFSVGEEFGWRGYAHPRMIDRYGPVIGSLILGSVWGVWHLGMAIIGDQGAFDPIQFLLATLELALYSLVIAWIFERANRSMFVAIAIHAGGHLDNVSRAPETEVRLRALRLVMVAIAAGLAARALVADRRRR